MANRQIVERFARAMGDKDLDTQDALVHEDYEGRYPQSGEVIRGRANRRALLENYPGAEEGLTARLDQILGKDDEFVTGPSWNIIHVAGTGDDFTLIGLVDYPDGTTWHIVSFLTLRQGKIWREVDYYAPRFDAPDWRKPYVDVEPSA